jgi:peptidoglycan/xylan/chitin deacetylase (PgdA/CDA1 family)
MEPGGWHGYSMDPEARRARRAERARRTRRRRLIALATVLVVLAGAGAAVALHGGAGTPAPASAGATSGTTPAPAAPAATSPATPAHRSQPPPPDALPTAAAQAAAVAAVQRVGVPIYRTPGRAGKVVALTFDDGPGPYSETTVATLKRSGMRATFFLCGKEVARFPGAPAAEATVAAMGDHTWNHVSLPALPAAEARSEIARTQAAVEEASGAPVRLFRSPYGARTTAIDATASDLGMIQVLWSLESGDSAGAGWREMLAKVESTLAPGDIVLFHENRGQTQKVINRLVPWMRRNGWRSVSVPQLLAMDPPSEAFLREQAGRFE